MSDVQDQAQQEVQAQDNAGALQADAQIVQQEAATTEPVTAEQVGEQTVAQSEGLAQPQEQQDVANTVPVEPVAPAAPAAVADSGPAAAVDDTAVVAVEPAPVEAPKPLSQSAQTVRAWIESMAAIAPHQTQKAFSDYLIENIASLDAFDEALGG